jgi:hypothetical protein
MFLFGVLVGVILAQMFKAPKPRPADNSIAHPNGIGPCKHHVWVYVPYNEANDERLQCSACNKFPGE